MIINHQYRFIFLKTRKTAGTSIEIALSKLCGESDVLTPISPDDERTRQHAGGRGPQNHILPLTRLKRSDWLQLIRTRSRPHIRRHVSSAHVRKYVPRDIWQSYFKFCFERNPFDKAISRYYWSTQEPRPPIDDYLETLPPFLLSNWNIYTIANQQAVDYVGRYECLGEDLAEIADRLRLPGTLELPHAKSSARKNREHYSQVLNVKARSRIESVCAREIELFGYHWSDHSERLSA